MNTKRQAIVRRIVTAAASAALLAAAGTAQAGWSRSPGAACHPAGARWYDPARWTVYGSQVVGQAETVGYDGGGIVNLAGGWLTLLCPITSTSAAPVSQSNGFMVDVYDGSSSLAISVRACVQWWGGGSTCGSATTDGVASNTGIRHIVASTYVWYADQEGGYPYVMIDLPGYASGTHSIVYGYAWTTP